MILFRCWVEAVFGSIIALECLVCVLFCPLMSLLIDFLLLSEQLWLSNGNWEKTENKCYDINLRVNNSMRT